MLNPTTVRHSDRFIKVCGLKDPDNIARVASLSPMLMGFIFHERSPRSAIGLSPDVVHSLPPYIRPVAVFRDSPLDVIIKTCYDYKIDIVQLHGAETPLMCRVLRDNGYKVIKAINVNTRYDLERPRQYVDDVDLMLFDTPSPMGGGSGQKFDWTLLKDYDAPIPYMLSGGIGPDDVDRVVEAVRPGMVGIDINSRFETEPGVKDISLLAKFILSLRQFNEDESIRTPFL